VRTRIRRITLVVPVLVGSVALVATTASASDRAGSSVPSYDIARAVPLSTSGPSWYDLGYFHRVMQAGTAGARLPSGARMPAAAGFAYPGIRPGTWLVTVTANSKEVGFAWCTANFVFRKRGVFGLGTAGHCAAKDALGAHPSVTAYVVPPPSSGRLPGFYHIGRFVLVRNRGIGDDFAMIRVFARYRSWVNPTMEVWGGPQGVYRSTRPTVVKWFGHGVVVGTGGTARAGVAPIWTARHGTAFAWYGPSAPGDSGAGVEAVGTGGLDLAAGDLTHIVVVDCGRPSKCPGQILPGMIAGTKMTTILRIARGWHLVKGSLLGVP